MTANKQTTEKKCCFYVSDFHLEMTIVPYINRKMAENKNVIIITENKLDESVKILISRMNIKNKEEILKLDWNNTDASKIANKDNLIIITNGSKNFIKEKNNEIHKFIKEEQCLELINCYSFDEVKDEILEITERHTEVLNNLQKNY